MKDEHAQFAGSIPAAYDRYLGHVLFQPYAEDLAARLQVPENGSVLELACGTGIVTRELRNRLPATAKLIATDLNEPMFQHAAAKFAKGEAVEWQQADACSLPFGDGIFDAVVCQFGIMFVPDKALAAREARRVLKPGGVFLLNVWDAIEHNELCRIAHETIAGYFDKDPPTFYQVPFGYHDHDKIRRVLGEAGFRDVRIEVVKKISGASRAQDTATGLVQGNPVSVAIAERDPSLLPVITNAIAAALKSRFGPADLRAPLRAIVVQARG
jgi:ubiquinone/menaquinone biosynthesis C-methylase UbiE